MDTKMLAIVGIVVVIAIIGLVYFISQPAQPQSPTPPQPPTPQLPTPQPTGEKVQVSDVKALLTQDAPVLCNYKVSNYQTKDISLSDVSGKAYVNGNWVKVVFDSTPAILTALSSKVDTSYVIANVDPSTLTATVFLKAKDNPNCEYYWTQVSVPNIDLTTEEVSADCYKQAVEVEQPEKKEGCEFSMALLAQ